ncbi:MAG: esterase-like activity of phytase family protein [Planctomycetota bacterium]
MTQHTLRKPRARVAQSALFTAGLFAAHLAFAAPVAAAQGQGPFRRVATFPVFENTAITDQTSAEIVAASTDGNLLIYTDSGNDRIGFIDITDPAAPTPGGVLGMTGEPTSVAVLGGYALVAVNTSADFINTSGDLAVVDLATRQVVRNIALGGQPDSVAVSPDGRYAAIAIENERDEELGNGAPPQLPAGYVVIVDLVGAPASWTTRNVDLVGVPDLYPDDPEPEYVDINASNIAVVTMQENNHIALIDLATGAVILDFSAGTVDLDEIDTNENDLIEQSSSLLAVPREPDAVSWISPFTFASADEGDLNGGSRGFTVWAPWGLPLYEAGSTIEHAAARIGHYPEGRSENKGTEPESAEFGDYNGDRFLFIGSERANLVFVYRLVGSPLFGSSNPMLEQILPTGVAPEGLLAIPQRDLLVVACEEDSRDDIIRGSVMIYQRTGQGNYPQIVSENRVGTSVPIPWAAQSGLVVAPGNDQVLYSIHDSFYQQSRVYRMERGAQGPIRITDELPLVDTNSVLGNALRRWKFLLPNTPSFDISKIINGDSTVNLDPEGIAVESDGTSFWIASEGAGNLNNGVSNPSNRPFASPNLLIKAVRNPGADTLEIVRVVGLPFEMTSNQLRFGLEGITVADDAAVYVCLQREWGNAGDPNGSVRIGRFDLTTGMWTFAFYPLDAVASANGGWVGLSEITYLGNGRLAVLERDNQGNADAAVKRVYTVDLNSVTFRDVSQAASFETLAKTLEIDLLAAGSYDQFAGFVPEKLEGMAVLSDGTTLIVNDNDGVDTNSGETVVVTLPQLLQ